MLLIQKKKLTELEDKIPDISSLATKTALTAVANKIPDVSSLVKKSIYDTRISKLEKKRTDHNHDKYITTPEFNTLAADVFNARLAQATLITKTDFDAKLSSRNRKITSNKSKYLLVKNEINELKKPSLDYLLGKMLFNGENGLQNYLYFSQYPNILKRLLVLVMAVTFITGNLKGCLTKELILLKHPMIALLQT